MATDSRVYSTNFTRATPNGPEQLLIAELHVYGTGDISADSPLLYDPRDNPSFPQGFELVDFHVSDTGCQGNSGIFLIKDAEDQAIRPVTISTGLMMRPTLSLARAFPGA